MEDDKVHNEALIKQNDQVTCCYCGDDFQYNLPKVVEKGYATYDCGCVAHNFYKCRNKRKTCPVAHSPINTPHQIGSKELGLPQRIRMTNWVPPAEKRICVHCLKVFRTTSNRRYAGELVDGAMYHKTCSAPYHKKCYQEKLEKGERICQRCGYNLTDENTLQRVKPL